MEPERDPDAPELLPSGPPAHRRLELVSLVAAGGVLGTSCREALSLLVPRIDDVPVVILAINVLGAFLLGLLIESLARRGPDAGRRRALRLALGTGVLGGFTTYSTLAVDTVQLLEASRPGVAALYAFSTLVVGALATTLGMALAVHRHRKGAP